MQAFQRGKRHPDAVWDRSVGLGLGQFLACVEKQHHRLWQQRSRLCELFDYLKISGVFERIVGRLRGERTGLPPLVKYSGLLVEAVEEALSRSGLVIEAQVLGEFGQQESWFA